MNHQSQCSTNSHLTTKSHLPDATGPHQSGGDIATILPRTYPPTPSIDVSTEAEEGVATEQRTTVRVVIWGRELFRGSENGIGHVFGTTDNDLL